MINSNTNNSNVMDMKAMPIEQGKLPLWFVVLSITVVIVLLSYAAVYFYQQQERNGSSQTEQAALAKQKIHLLKQDGVIKTNWLRTLNNKMKNVQGGVIWNGKQQQGIIHVQYLPKTIKQQYYRLWIYDLATQANKRVSGALFQHKGNGVDEHLITITPEVPVKQPYKFELVLLESNDRNQAKGRQDDNEHPLLFAQP